MRIAYCVTKFPWIENPLRLISWLEMNKFSAESYLRIGAIFGSLQQILPLGESLELPTPVDKILNILLTIEAECRDIALVQSEKCTRRAINGIKDGRVEHCQIKTAIDCVFELIVSEMQSELFFAVPIRRAGFYAKDAEAIVGAECCARLPSVQREVEESAKCYAFGRFTASAFHLMRATEVAVKALAMTVGYTPQHPGWKEVFSHVYKQFQNSIPRHAAWTTHEDFLTTTCGDLRTISKVWRNDIAHFVDTYSENEAAEMLVIIPKFLSRIAERMDETGKLY